nr:sulfatase-like hydrolase/transferase [Roseibacillus persicicus]
MNLRPLAVSALFCVFPVAAKAEPPNVILLMSDDQGWGDVGFNGHPDLLTPNLDEMARSGAKFERFYAASPLCSPTRGSCLTGRYPFRYGILAAHTGGMRVGEITVAEMVKEKGYQTGFFGKWHIGWVDPDDVGSRGYYSPPGHHGFDYSFATTSAVPTWDPGITPKGWSQWGQKEGEPWKGGAPYFENGKPVSENMSGDDSRIIMDRVIPFIEKNKEQPFLATVWFHAPHDPVVAGPEYKKLYREFGSTRQNYYGCITAMDEQIGRLRSKLRELGLEKKTVVFFCSDNGPSDGATRKGIASAGPFKGHKHTMYEGGTLVPACAEWPGVIQPETIVSARCATVDFFPTIAGLVDFSFSSKERRPIDGVDLMPFMKNDKQTREGELFFGFRRLVQEIDGKALISGDYKLLQEAKKGGGRIRLYNIAEDPFEERDLAKDKPALVKELFEKVEAIERSCQVSRDGADYRY